MQVVGILCMAEHWHEVDATFVQFLHALEEARSSNSVSDAFDWPDDAAYWHPSSEDVK